MLNERVKLVIRAIVLTGCFSFAFPCALAAAIPTAVECKAARAKLAELTEDDYKALKAKSKTNEQVGDALLEYADNEESAAGKFALLQDAFQQYVLGKSADKADSAYSKALAIGGVEYALEMARPARAKLSAYATSKNASAKALKERIAADEKSFQRVGIVKAKLKKAPGDESLCEQLGIEYAAIGDWESALAAFVTAAGEVAKVADWELNGGKGSDYTAATAGAFWWKFADNFPKRKNVEESMKLHAAMWYKLAFDKDAFKGNEKAIVEKRIAETEKFVAAEQQEKEIATKKMSTLDPIKLELSKGNVVELIGCPAGEFEMGCAEYGAINELHTVVISRPFWLSKYKITRRQFGWFQAEPSSEYIQKVGGDDVPRAMCYWDAVAFCEKLTKRFKGKIPKGYVIRLPTEAEWEYALKANEKEDGLYRNWKNFKQEICVDEDLAYALAGKQLTAGKKGWELGPVKVGLKKPNAWGFYDIFGNGGDITLDTIDIGGIDESKKFWLTNQKVIPYAPKEVDPLRITDNSAQKARCLVRGVGFNSVDGFPYGKNPFPLSRGSCVIQPCIHLCIGPDLMKEKGYDKKSQKKR